MGGLRVVFRVERRWVEMNADSARRGLVPAFISERDCLICCASRDAMCRYLEQGENWHFMKTWRACWDVSK